MLGKETKKKPWLSCRRLSNSATGISPPSTPARTSPPSAPIPDSSNSSTPTRRRNEERLVWTPVANFKSGIDPCVTSDVVREEGVSAFELGDRALGSKAVGSKAIREPPPRRKIDNHGVILIPS